MGSLVSRDELRRLEKAAREKDKRKLVDWVTQFENQMETVMRRDYERAYQEEMENLAHNTLSAVAYTLFFSEENYINKDNLADFMADLFVTIDMFRTGEYTPKDYEEELAKYRVTLDNYDSDNIYKKYLNIFDTDLVNFLKNKYRKIITICGSAKFKEEILQVQFDLSLQGNIVMVDGVYTHSENAEILLEELQQIYLLNFDKILISDAIYVVNKDKYIGEGTAKLIQYAKDHNKEIIYMEKIEE